MDVLAYLSYLSAHENTKEQTQHVWDIKHGKVAICANLFSYAYSKKQGQRHPNKPQAQMFYSHNIGWHPAVAQNRRIWSWPDSCLSYIWRTLSLSPFVPFALVRQSLSPTPSPPIPRSYSPRQLLRVLCRLHPPKPPEAWASPRRHPQTHCPRRCTFKKCKGYNTAVHEKISVFVQ